MNRDLITLYGLPSSVAFCETCTVSNQRPRISFDQFGVCSACRFAERKRELIDWSSRESELRRLCDYYRRDDGSFDVVVPVSGGKDGGFVAHQLKYVYGMNPLTVTWAPLRSTDIGLSNLRSFIDSGFDHVMGTPDPEVTRRLTAASFRRLGDPFQPFIYGQTNFPLTIATRFNIPLIMYGENGEVEYGGDMKNADSPTRELSDHAKHYFSGINPLEWQESGISSRELKRFDGPPHEDVKRVGVSIHFFSYYKFWDPQENYYYCSSNTGFRTNPERSEGTYSKYASLDDRFDGFHYYLGFVKFGIGRATSDSAHEIRDGRISRDEGIALVRKYDGEFPEKHLDEFLEYVRMTRDEFDEIIDSWRSPHIWERSSTGWNLKHPIWESC